MARSENYLKIEYLALKLFEELYKDEECDSEILEEVKNAIKSKTDLLMKDRIKILDNKARRLADDYHNMISEELERKYADELGDEGSFIPPVVSFDENIYELWKIAVREKRTVKMKYESASSGLGERLVDPYQSRAPYVEGYCHKRKELLKFRMDRVIDLELTDKKFIKKKYDSK